MRIHEIKWRKVHAGHLAHNSIIIIPFNLAVIKESRKESKMHANKVCKAGKTAGNLPADTSRNLQVTA